MLVSGLNQTFLVFPRGNFLGVFPRWMMSRLLRLGGLTMGRVVRSGADFDCLGMVADDSGI